MNRVGIDIGSTTVKIAILDDENQIIFSAYERHFANIQETLKTIIERAFDELGDREIAPMITGSGGLSISKHLDIPFVQEVVSVATSLKSYAPHTDVAIELGGEDAKIIYFTGGIEQRMNGICAGGTGSFIDQMATLLKTDAAGLNEYAKYYQALYPIASRCGVFAKTDIQPLINEGAAKADLAASIFQAVVNQTISGLACGKPIRGNVAFLGGPLHFLTELKKAFIRTLDLKGDAIIAPENSHLFAASGAAMNSTKEGITTLGKLRDKLSHEIKIEFEVTRMEPLFQDEDEYQDFLTEHQAHNVTKGDLSTYEGNAFLGVDAGSTTTKVALVGEDGSLLYSFYDNNNGSPLKTTIKAIKEIYQILPEGVNIVRSCSTGYGEALIQSALMLDEGEVETVSHYYAASFFEPQVDCILDIGGQDIKCFKIRNNAIDNIFLNEACSSGCGSFLQTFAAAWGYNIADFSKLGLFADRPVDLGSRCTVFMNSSVKQAQKDGASIENISAGLSISVVKNALYKVIRAANADELGKNIVVQGGTFLNDAVLRAFEQEIGRNVVCPNISGIMGAYGAALYSMERAPEKSTLISAEELKTFEHKVKAITCGKCSNNCRLTVNTFSSGRSFIGGNRCSKPIARSNADKGNNLFDYKRELLAEYKPVKGKRETIGLPMGLNMFELLPFWHTFFTQLGFGIALSEKSSRELYVSGQHTIPSDTVCYPAKLLHGHIESLISQGVKNIFYPCMSYNIDEKLGDNNYNCPVVAYYPEVIRSNVGELKKLNFMNDYLGLHRPKDFSKKIYSILCNKFGSISFDEVKNASDKAYDEYHNYMKKIHHKGLEYLKEAKENDKPVIVLCGRPYHLDEEINHGIDKLICECGATVITEDSVSPLVNKFPTGVLDQWTYHSRLYAAAKYVAKLADKDVNIVQLVSFGCGVDAITTDEMRAILESDGKIYTQIKIDEISNPGAVKIRLRSLFAATGR